MNFKFEETELINPVLQILINYMLSCYKVKYLHLEYC